MNAIAFMSVDGLLDCHIEEGSVDGDVFFTTIQRLLVPHMPFNGTNPHSVIVLDNASIHHVDEVITSQLRCISTVPPSLLAGF